MSYTLRQPSLKAVNPVVALTLTIESLMYEGWNFNSGNYLFKTDTK